MDTNEMKMQLATKAKTGVTGGDPAKTIAQYLERMKPQIQLAIPKHITPDRLARIALTTIRSNPKLLRCSIPSLMAAVMQAAQLGLEPGLLGHCYIIPYENRKKGIIEAIFIIGYRGMLDLARRSGDIKSISVQEVYANDIFKITRKLEMDELEHVPWYAVDGITEPGELKAMYGIARFKDGGYYYHHLTKRQIDEHRNRSMASHEGPWVTDYIEMAKKTVIRSAWKWLPLSVEIQKSVLADETVKTEIEPSMVDLPPIETDYKVIEEEVNFDKETGEVIEKKKERKKKETKEDMVNNNVRCEVCGAESTTSQIEHTILEYKKKLCEKCEERETTKRRSSVNCEICQKSMIGMEEQFIATMNKYEKPYCIECEQEIQEIERQVTE